jgi:hypothetical protein
MGVIGIDRIIMRAYIDIGMQAKLCKCRTVAKKSREQILPTLTDYWRELVERVPDMTPAKAGRLATPKVSANHAMDIMRGRAPEADPKKIAALVHVLKACPTCHRPWPAKEQPDGPSSRRRRTSEKA